ncbi:MAG TPA: outer membrane protein transport protein, partial [Nitrospirales bacterium]|nr:outer membrane protein transport protein [Nitrospirales bacterium]
MSAQPAPVEANGFRILSQSASALGQSDAFTAQADDPSAVYYNPAGMTQLKGLQVMAGGLIIGGGTTFTQAATGLKTRSDLGGTVATPPPLYGYATWNLAGVGEKLNLRPLERVTLGFGVLSPFGLKVQWPATTTAPLNTALTSVAVELVDFKPTVAVKVLPDLSVGVGADIYTYLNMYGQGHAEIQFNSSGGPGLPPAGTPIEINGRNTTAGFNLSL